MPAKDRNDYTVRSRGTCPHYRGDAPRPRAIKCDGLFGDSVQRITFHDLDGFWARINGFCCGDWQKCPYNRNR